MRLCVLLKMILQWRGATVLSVKMRQCHAWSGRSRALLQHLDVIIDYVIEEELPRVRELAAKHHAPLYYIVLTADAEELEKRIRNRGDTDMLERALFLKRELEAMPENRGHLYNNTGKTTEEMIGEIQLEQYLVREGNQPWNTAE